jgi:hypothetical protein
MPITLNGSSGITTPAIQSWVSLTANANVTAGQHILADTSAGVFTLTLPATPALNEAIVFADRSRTWDTNNLTVARNGNTIEGLAENLTCNVENGNFYLIYNGTTWRIFIN